jgi:hypothetical protein
VTDPKVNYSCETCGQQVRFGPNVYEGKYIPRYQIMVCSGCYAANWDGWAPQFETAVTRKLLEQGQPIPARNAKGWLPRDG